MTSLLLAFILLSGDPIEPQWPAVCDDIHILHGGRTVADTCLIATLNADESVIPSEARNPPIEEIEEIPRRLRDSEWNLCPESERELALWTRPLSFVPLPPGLMSWHCLKP
jgi:hypothetical protein